MVQWFESNISNGLLKPFYPQSGITSSVLKHWSVFSDDTTLPATSPLSQTLWISYHSEWGPWWPLLPRWELNGRMNNVTMKLSQVADIREVFLAIMVRACFMVTIWFGIWADGDNGYLYWQANSRRYILWYLSSSREVQDANCSNFWKWEEPSGASAERIQVFRKWCLY